jgi:hypothetical protein
MRRKGSGGMNGAATSGTSKAEWAGVFVALGVGFASFAVSVTSCISAQNNNEEANKRLDDQEERAALQEQQKYAVYVELGEAPQETHDSNRFREEMPPLDSYPWSAVVNSNDIQVRDVWVEYPDRRFIWIGTIPRCTAYALDLNSEMLGPPPGVQPRAVYFKDPWTDWRRSFDGTLKSNGWKDTPRAVTIGNQHNEDDGAAPSLPLSNCGG